MPGFNANTELFQQLEFKNRPALFSILRIDRSTIPEGIEQYEIRHSDWNAYAAVELGRTILVNHLGTLLMSEPLQLAPNGYLDVTARDFKFSTKPEIPLAFFQKYHPPKEKNVFEMVPGTPEERDWFYSDTRHAASRGYVGSVSGDFEMCMQLQANFMPKPGNRLPMQELMEELSRMIDWLQGESAPLHSAGEMRRFCNRFSHTAALAGSAYGFRIHASNYVYYMRCQPERETFEIRCYDREKHHEFMSRHAGKKWGVYKW